MYTKCITEIYAVVHTSVLQLLLHNYRKDGKGVGLEDREAMECREEE